jgi:hypothetical protein
VLLALAETINVDVLVTRDKEFRETAQEQVLIRDPKETLAMAESSLSSSGLTP